MFEYHTKSTVFDNIIFRLASLNITCRDSVIIENARTHKRLKRAKRGMMVKGQQQLKINPVRLRWHYKTYVCLTDVHTVPRIQNYSIVCIILSDMLGI